VVPRRVPAGSLAALAVILAALAVVVVAGARDTILRVTAPAAVAPTTQPASPTTTSPPHTSTPSTPAPSSPGSRGDEVSLLAPPPTSAPRPTTTTTTTTPTTTSTSTTTTTTPVTPVTDATGTFAHGATAARIPLGPVHQVTASVTPGVDVTLTVTCGPLVASASSASSVSVSLDDGPSACTAVIEIPNSSLPTHWQLVAR
jgi:cytoskeletal protein RodZ